MLPAGPQGRVSLTCQPRVTGQNDLNIHLNKFCLFQVLGLKVNNFFKKGLFGHFLKKCREIRTVQIAPLEPVSKHSRIYLKTEYLITLIISIVKT